MSVHFQPKFIKAIVGRKIVKCVELDAGGGEYWPGLKLDDGSTLIIACDAEGNGGGFMSLLDKDENEVGCAG